MTHSGFERIPLSRRHSARVLRRSSFTNSRLAIREQRRREHAAGEGIGARARSGSTAKLEALSAEHKKDNTLTFEELGVDRLFVDEAHYFKNLFYVTKMTRIAGLPQTASNARSICSSRCGTSSRRTTAAAWSSPPARPSPTPWRRCSRCSATSKWARCGATNSITSIRGRRRSASRSRDGTLPGRRGYRLQTRFARFINVPELMQKFRQVADVQTAEMLNLPRPEAGAGQTRTAARPRRRS